MSNSHAVWWIPTAIAAAAGILGVLIGGFITAHSQKE
jgi:hypothetical protein